MRYRVTMKDNFVWIMDVQDAERPAIAIFHDDIDQVGPGDWIYTPHSLMGVGGDIIQLAFKIAEWADLEGEWDVAEVVPMLKQPATMGLAGRRVPRYAQHADERHSQHATIGDVPGLAPPTHNLDGSRRGEIPWPHSQVEPGVIGQAPKDPPPLNKEERKTRLEEEIKVVRMAMRRIEKLVEEMS
jgi:hypothetical protein